MSSALPAEEPPAIDPDELTERDLTILAFEHHWWKHQGAKEQAIKDELDLSATRYYQLLRAIIDKPAALRHDPMLVKRLRRLQETRQGARSAHR